MPAVQGLRGALQVPGDKSISHRAVLLGAVSSGPVAIEGFLRSDDTLATVAAVRALGVEVEELGHHLVVHGDGWDALREPENVIDVANSGTLIRLLPGIVACRDFLSVLTGDASIRRRPMRRVLEPLSLMGATVNGRANNTLPPISLRGGNLRAVDHVLAVASAQVKSCLLLAGLRADGVTSVTEPGGSRDHTERMIRQGGGRVERDGALDASGVVRVWPVEVLDLKGVEVPGDFSSAAFLLVAALLVPDSEVTVERVGLNPTRVGLLGALQRMGADIQVDVTDPSASEPLGRVTARYSELKATDIAPAEVPSLIDELPAFLLAAARADGTSRISGAAELRFKESDRLAAMGRLLSGEPRGWRGGHVETHGDHRLAMVGAIAGCASGKGVSIDDVDCISVSFPGFVDTLSQLGGHWHPETQDQHSGVSEA
jgi:3-phosphoshikimate 1-carboxyvinyltransferase